MTKRPVIVDQRQADLRKIDVEIERLEKQIADKRAASNADQEKHPLDQNAELQKRLETQIRALRGHVDKLQKDRFDVELGDLAEPKRQQAPATPAKVYREWELKPVHAPEYPAIARTEENHKTFSDTFERMVEWAIYRKNLGLKEAGCRPDQKVELDLVAMIAAQGDAHHLWLSQRCAAIEKRLAEVEARPTMSYRGVWSQGTDYRRGDVCTHQGSSWHCELESATGLQPGDGLGWKLMVKKGRDARP
ncbi:hypothetical protein [Mesorhizobium qingshengii]|uniref:Uncharacterized protein n=1 Tax=Mesorhizobium qingshengii TaxID=1165689 RepID=A0A1G5V339_9HYPH|nr:hypothetical protein [Mesorhizobium qingshengii]SDA40279.1 hypothetical protein SAMN02927914_00222 [Mesorhizobium qingshengii]